VKIAFLSLEASEPLAYGLMVLSASLRAHGHACALVQARNVEAVIADPTTANADVLALSATTGLHRVYLAWAKALRGRFPDKIIVLGGPHATFYPRAIELAPLDSAPSKSAGPKFCRASTGMARSASIVPTSRYGATSSSNSGIRSSAPSINA